jgi:hypothetical protein
MRAPSLAVLHGTSGDEDASAIANIVGWVDKGNPITSYSIASAEESDRSLQKSFM